MSLVPDMLIRKLTSYTITCLALLCSQAVISAPGDVLSSFSISNVTGDGRTPTTPQGITFYDGKLYIVDFGTDRIYRTYPEQVLDTDEITVLFSPGDSDLNLPLQDVNDPPINSDGTPIGRCGTDISGDNVYCGGGGLTFAQNFLWNASPVTDDIIKIDPVDGDNLESENTLASLAFPAPTDMTFDGTHFWIVDWQTNTINKVLPETGVIISSIPGPSSSVSAKPFGITWDGQALWVSERSDDTIYRIDPSDGAILNAFPSPGANPHGLAWDGEFLWHTDQTTQTIYKLESGVIPFGIIGCVEKNGKAVNGDVLLSQTAEADQSTTTDIDGCFTFSSFVSGVPVKVDVSESGLDEKPIITLSEINGSSDVTLIVGDTYSEPGFTAIDTEDGDISLTVVAVPDVINNPSLINTSTTSPAEGYIVTYNVVDSAGNLADQRERKVFVLDVDVTAPVITLIGDNPMNVEQASSYTEPGATAADARDGDLSSSIVVSGAVDANTTGIYTLSYDVSDLTGNPATTITRSVNVADTTIPVITLIGSDPVTLEKGDPYADAGASATDNIDGDISGSITVSGSVTQNTVGSYVLTYNIADASGNTATTVTRTVNVVDTTIPVITLIGSTPYNQELNTSFTDPGATATDSPAEDLTSSIVTTGTVNTAIAGTYILTYNVTDTASNTATSVTRDVIVSDTGAPTITLLGNNPLSQELGLTYTDPGATATDSIDGNLTANIIIAGDIVDPNTIGTYNVTYNVSDSALNAAPTQTRSIVVADTTPPLITLTGAANILHELNTTYVDAGSTASDNTDGDITANIVVGGDAVNTSTAGIYTITYNVVDAATNAAAPITRIVDVADRTAPVITLSGANPLNHEVGTIFVDPGASATDIIDGNLTASIGVTGTVDVNTIGSYTINYNISDSSANAATTAVRTVNVVDTGAPTITLLGNSPINHELNTTFTDPGATASDAADGDVTASVIATGAVNNNLAGTYTLIYNVVDSQSNNAPTVTRNVVVADTTAPIITLAGSATLNHEQGTAYTDAGASASDIIDGDITANIVVTGAVDANTAGTYALSYNVSDAVSNSAITVTRTVTVVDSTIPVITLLGADPLSHEVGTIFTDPGATALDNIDGTITANIGVTGAVDANTVGSYTLTYNVSDSSSNTATTVIRTVNVTDTGAPTILLLGNSPLNHELNTAFTDPGATASDAADGNLTSSIVATGTVNSNLAGTYTLTYNVTDSQTNAAPTVTRNVIVADTTAPVITLTGSSSVNVEQGTSYTELNATASDIIDGDISANIVIGGSVNVNVGGTYILTYNVSDAVANAATQLTRTIIVSDTTHPVITLTGSDPLNHEVGTIFVDPAATASDNIDGDITANIGITGSVNANVVGAYILSYNISDSAGNAATTVTRTVNVADTGAPVITMTGSNPLNHELNTVFTDLGASASDVVDDDATLTAAIVVVSNVNANVTGTYTITYNVTDSGGNPAAQQTRTVNVNDFTAPVISLTGSSTINVELGSSYTDAGATASDNIDGDLTASIVSAGAVDPLTAGNYILSYDISDAAGNNASQVTRTVVVSDTTSPVITLLGSATINHEQGTAYSDPGSSATDNTDGDITANITVSGFVDANAAGSYVLSYNVSDAVGNNATTVTRTITVADTIIPVLTLTGSSPFNHEQGTTYTDQGGTASDSVDGDITANIIVTGAVDINAAGSYTLTYNVSDTASNAATTITRNVIVADTIAPTVTLLGSSTINHEQGSAYTDAGATAADVVDGDVTAGIIVTGSVDVNTAGTYILSYNVSDAATNTATTVTRTVVVADTTLPTIALLGSSIVNHEQAATYTDAGATANDNIDGVISVNIVVTGSVDINLPGTYTLSYNVNDAAGNAAVTITRDVIIADTSAPVITLTGSATVNVEQGSSYSDAGATASDNVDGNISASIIVSGDIVDPNTSGTYIIRYDISDAATNAATQVTRTVVVTDTTIPVISLLGITPTNHQQGTAYIDSGVTAIDNINGDIAINVVVTGTVDVNTASTYTLTYNVSDGSGNAAIAVTRDVIVADTAPPAITLIGGTSINHEQGDTYTDAGATATDTIDGEVTASIVVTGTVDINTAGSYILSYNVSDIATNAATTVTRTVNVSDTIAPVITLQGDTTVDSTLGQLFTDPGTTASDNINGDISANVVTSGTIDINTAGTYILSYDVADTAGNNATTVNRTVNIVSPVIVSIEAETATIGGAHVAASTNAGFTGSGYIEHSGEGYIEYTFTAFSVPYDLTVRYALDTGDKPLEVILNSASLGNLSFPSTGSFTTWGNTATFSITPLSGSNTIRLQTTGTSGANVDQLTLTPQ